MLLVNLTSVNDASVLDNHRNVSLPSFIAYLCIVLFPERYTFCVDFCQDPAPESRFNKLRTKPQTQSRCKQTLNFQIQKSGEESVKKKKKEKKNSNNYLYSDCKNQSGLIFKNSSQQKMGKQWHQTSQWTENFLLVVCDRLVY